MTQKLEDLVYAMLTEDTGSHPLDSGGAYGRHWQRNAKLSLDDFKRAPSATLDVHKGTLKTGEIYWSCSPTVSLFHAMVNTLSLDALCDEFNALECDVFNGEYYGTNADQSLWLADHEFTPKGECFNIYNEDSNLSQILQGQVFTLQPAKEWDDLNWYVLLQVHNGCDARGGYTDAKLFKLESEDTIYSLLGGSCSFETSDGALSLEWQGEWINGGGRCASDAEITAFCERLGEGVHAGEAYFDY